MSVHTTNGISADSPVGEQWEELETPFLGDVSMIAHDVADTPEPTSRLSTPLRNESPFLSEYSGEVDAGGPRAQVYAEMMSELSDTEFSEALEDLVNEASAVAEDRFSSETSDPTVQRFDADRAVRGYLEPIARSAEAMIGEMAEGLAGVDLSSASESEVDAVLQRFTPPADAGSPVAEQFLGGLLNKAKNAVKAAAKLAGKVTSLLPINIILGRLKGLVRPLLERVLRAAIDRLPVAVRPIAKQLAQRFLGITVSEAAEELEDSQEAAAVDPAQLEQELDTEIVGYVMDGESFEQEAAAERAVSDESSPVGDPLHELARRRRHFAHHVVRVRRPEEIEPVMEEFVPAILAALKIGIKIIGRPRVVSFLSGLVSSLIKSYIGPDQAKALSGALVDAGLRTLDLEAETEGENSAVGYALGATVEDTISRLVQDAPATAWENEDMLAAYTYEAFQQAASAHFPDTEIRDDLHEAASHSGVWTLRPHKSPHKAYKRYSRVLEVAITPQAAASVKTFGGVTLRAFLTDRLGLDATKDIRARAHLFEAIPGTRLGLIALHEKSIRGLGTAARVGRSQIHPLTPAAASTLFGEPGLAHAVAARFLEKRGHIKVGQRFYFLEIPGARVRLAPRHEVAGQRPARSSQAKVVVDLVKREVRVLLYLSEREAQKLTAQIRQKASVAALLATLKMILTSMFKHAAHDPHHLVKVIHETAPTENHESAFVSTIMSTFGHVIGDKAEEWLLEAVRRELTSRYDAIASELERATANEADGVTLRVVLSVPVLEKLRALSNPTGLFGVHGIIKSLRKAKVVDYHLTVHPGFGGK